MNYTIRKATRQDCIRLIELIHELAEYEKASQEVTVSLEEFEEAGFGEKPVWEALVIEVDAIIQGMALFYIRYSTWKGCTLYLEDLVITETMRGHGLGTLLFEKVWQTCQELNYSRMAWQVLDWNVPAINFYKKYNVTFDKGWLNVALTNTH